MAAESSAAAENGGEGEEEESFRIRREKNISDGSTVDEITVVLVGESERSSISAFGYDGQLGNWTDFFRKGTTPL